MMLEALAVERPNDVDTVSPEELSFTPEELLLLRFYRKLDPPEQFFMRRAIEGLIAKRSRP